MTRPSTYVGVQNEINGGMTPIAKLVRDAWVFEILPEEETCEGWDLGRVNLLLDEVNREWDKYGCLVSRLPVAMMERHNRIHSVAIEQARAAGWSGEFETSDEG